MVRRHRFPHPEGPICSGSRQEFILLFDANSSYLDSDAVFGVRPSLIVDRSGDEVTCDFVLERVPASGPASM